MPDSTFPKRVLAAALFDALKSAVDAAGGMGSGRLYTLRAAVPLCLYGFLHHLGEFLMSDLRPGEPMESLSPWAIDARFGVGPYDNDRGVGEIREQLGLSYESPSRLSARPRVPFESWAEYFNIQRAAELPAAVFDALKASSDKFGGIGTDSFDNLGSSGMNELEGAAIVPYCVAGHAAFFDTAGTNAVADGNTPTLLALQKALGLRQHWHVFNANDEAVYAINGRKGEGVEIDKRVTFEEWAEQLNVVRGAE